MQTVENAITAFAGGGQTNATALSPTATFHRVSTVTASNDSVRLPVSVVGAMHFVVHAGAGVILRVYGAGTDTISGVATATGVPIMQGSGAWFICTAAGNWTTTTPFANGNGNTVYAN